MQPSLLIRPVLAASLAAGLAACVARTPASAGAAGAPVTAPAASAAAPDTTPAAPAAPARRGYVEADVRFMQRMILHHVQALAMAAMAPTHGAREDLRLVAERIDVSQRDEIALMTRWLRARGEAVPDTAAGAHAHHAMGAPGAGGAMPGMLAPEELARLDAARGAAFDRLFLEFMIRHHEGALTMVREYRAHPGAAEESEVFRFSNDVAADQRSEIRRMRALLASLQP